MTACSAPETNSATIGLPNSTSAAPRGTSMQSDSRTARRTPRRMRSSRPAPRFCPTYVLRESPMMLPGCSASERIFTPVVYAATVAEPKPLTTPCRIIPPTAVTEFMTPTGTPRRSSSRSIAPSGLASPF